MLDEVEAHAAKARRVQTLEIMLGKGVVGVGDAAVAAAARGDRIDDHAVVGTVAACVHEHRTRQAERRLQLAKTLERCIGRRVAAIGRIRILVGRPEDVAMRITGALRRAVRRRACIRIRSLAGGNHS